VRRAVAFLTVLGRFSAPNGSTVAWFPLAGVLIGLAVGGAWWAADSIWPPVVVGAVAVTADLAITGMLHLDGLVDSADGLLPHLTPDRRLEVMAEPTVGAFGIGAAVAILLLRFAGFATLRPDLLLIAGLWCLARAVMAVAVRAVPYGRPAGGLARSFRGEGSWILPAASGLALGYGLLAVGDGVRGIAAGLGATATGAAVLALGVRRLGGYTGDVLGAAGVVAETVGLLVASARW